MPNYFQLKSWSEMLKVITQFRWLNLYALIQSVDQEIVKCFDSSSVGKHCKQKICYFLMGFTSGQMALCRFFKRYHTVFVLIVHGHKFARSFVLIPQRILALTLPLTQNVTNKDDLCGFAWFLWWIVCYSVALYMHWAYMRTVLFLYTVSFPLFIRIIII